MYHFLTGEGKDRNQLHAYFFATHDDSGVLPPITVEQARQALADFSAPTAAGKLTLPGKLNARLMLGFSSTCPVLAVVDSQVLVRDDVRAVDTKSVMTDGCGLISASLLTDLPFAIRSGVPVCARRAPGSPPDQSCGVYIEASLPNTIQIRLSCKKGLFKGCLIVSSDPSLCPIGCVVLRSSMLKVPGAAHIKKHTPCPLFVNNTFERAELFPASAYRNNPGTVVAGHSSPNPWSANLSVDMVLLLCHLGLPAQFVIDLAQREIADIESITTNRGTALDLVHRILRRGDRKEQSGDQEDGDCEVEQEQEEEVSAPMPYVSTSEEGGEGCLSARYSSCTSSRGDNVLRALHFFFAGHDLHEPQLQKYLHSLQRVALKKLKGLKFRLPNSAFAVGVPDPYGVLEENEVFVYIPLSAEENRMSAVYDNCEVLVTRYPMHHPGDIRKLRAVSHPQLTALVGDSPNPVVMFSIKGRRSQADMMGGGDFDGDLYCVIFHKAVVDAVTAVAPYEASDYPPMPVVSARSLSSSTTATMRDALGHELLHSVLRSSSNSNVGICSLTWMVFADRDPSSAEARKCDHYARLALDAAKTGFDSSKVDLPKVCAKPDHMLDRLANIKDTFVSTSAVGQVRRLIEDKIGSLTADSAVPRADPDICTVVKDGAVVFSMQEEAQHGDSSFLQLYMRWQKHICDYCKDLGSANGSERQDNTRIKAERMQGVKDRFIDLFDRDAAALPQLVPRLQSLDAYTARRVMAALVYNVTYVRDPKNGEYRLSFCWEMCAAELHDNKRRSVALQTLQHEYDLLPRGYLRDMYRINK